MDNFVIHRILGNDLPPRHYPRQTLDNLQFILDHEPSLPNLEKRWIVNRIASLEIEAKIIDLLCSRSQRFIRIGFNLDEYRALQPDYSHFTEQGFVDFLNNVSTREHAKLVDHALRKKTQYLTNVNSARNLALREGRSYARWILPWDGNCFLTETSWKMILEQVGQVQDFKYIIVPMERLLNNKDILDPAFNPAALEEPQIIFRNDSLEEFDEELRYARFSKTEFLRRLGVPGAWDNWDYLSWEKRQWTLSSEFGQWRRAGWVARLFSGEQAINEDPDMDGFSKRSRARRIAIRQVLKKLDERVLRHSLSPDRLLVYDENLLHLAKDAWQKKEDSRFSRLADSVITQAENVLLSPFYSVVQKPSIPPSGDPHDYFSLAPFWWPNPETPDGLPYVRRDSKRAPESEVFSKESEKYDYSRLQAMFECVTVLALAWHFTESLSYARHAVEMVRTWFLMPETRMNPHLQYSQVRPGYDYGGREIIIEAKDFYYFLDAVRLLQRSPAYLPQDRVELVSWCEEYLFWLLNSEQGCSEALKKNNHGTCYDLQVMALCGFLGDYGRLADASDRSKARLSSQFSSDGSQANELTRTDALHYCTFNLQSWFNLALLAESAGVDLWNYPTRFDSTLEKAFRWLIDQEKCPSPACSVFDESRFGPLITVGARKFGLEPSSFLHARSVEPRHTLHPYAGVPPYWPLVFGLSYIEYNWEL